MANRKGRTTVYNDITSDEYMSEVNVDNLELERDFLDYLQSTDRAKSTIKQYEANLHIFWCWNLKQNRNKFFVNITKREFSKFQSYALTVWGWSPKRIRTVKSTLSSLGNYIENILDDEFPNYRSVITKIESPADEPVRTKTIFQMEELQEVLDAFVEMEKYEYACMLALAIYSGRRKAELPRFKVSYFDDENLICKGALYKTPEKMLTKGRGQRGKMLDVYVIAKPFKPYLDMWLKQRKKIDGHRGNDWLFPKRVGNHFENQPVTPAAFDRLARAIERIVERPVYIHSLRHFFTTYLLEQNLPESIVQTIQGWTSGDMVHVYDDRSADSQLEQFFGEDGIINIKRKKLEDI